MDELKITKEHKIEMFVNEETSKPITAQDLINSITKFSDGKVKRNDILFYYCTNDIKKGIEIELFYEKDGGVFYGGYPIIDTITQKLAKFEDYRR